MSWKVEAGAEDSLDLTGQRVPGTILKGDMRCLGLGTMGLRGQARGLSCCLGEDCVEMSVHGHDLEA